MIFHLLWDAHNFQNGVRDCFCVVIWNFCDNLTQFAEKGASISKSAKIDSNIPKSSEHGFVSIETGGVSLRRCSELCLSNMARMKTVGRCGARRIKVEKQLQVVEQVVYDDADVDEVDPNVELVTKLHKGLKLFKDIAGDSDGEVTSVCFVYVFARCDQCTVIVDLF